MGRSPNRRHNGPTDEAKCCTVIYSRSRHDGLIEDIIIKGWQCPSQGQRWWLTTLSPTLSFDNDMNDIVDAGDSVGNGVTGPRRQI